MQRICFKHWKYYLFFICFFILGFCIGFYYWQIILPYLCLSTNSLSSPEELNIKNYDLFYNHFQYRTSKTCRNDRINLFLTIGILSSFERLNIYLPSIFETWLLTTTNDIEIIIFLEEKSSNKSDEEFLERFFKNLNKKLHACTYIVKLKHVKNEYPPQKKSFYAMKYLYTYYYNRTSWILRLDDNAYVNIPELMKWLKSIDYRQTLYIGQGGTGRRTGPDIYFPLGKYFCMGGSGVILSQKTLIELGPWLDYCLQYEIRTNHEDVELGRCILTHVHIGCTNAYNSKNLFYHHYGPEYEFGYDFTPYIISQAFILHPINQRNTFRQIFSFYQRKLQKTVQLSEWKPANTINYVTFLNSMEFDLIRDIHYQLIDVRWKNYIDTTVRSYIEHLQKVWHQRSSNYTIINGKFLFGYHRFLPTYGLELIIEVILNVRSISTIPSRSIIVRKRFHIRQPFINKNYLNYREIAINKQIQLNLIIISCNKDHELKRFIDNFQNEILNNIILQKQFTLTILYFHPRKLMKNFLEKYLNKHSTSIRLILINQTEHEYNRGLGRQLALKYFTNNQLLFFLDVDLIFTSQSLVNTRQLILHQLSISACAVYFPIIYSTFSSKFLRKNQTINDDDGLFSIYGFGNVAVRKQDLEKIGGWQITNYEWGNEDVDLFTKFVQFANNSCRIFRAVEPGLKHIYHKKMCDGIKNKHQQKMCYDAEAMLLGSQKNMRNYLLKNHVLNLND